MGFEDKGIVCIGVILGNVHGVQVSRAAGGYLHHLAAQGLHQRGVFALGVDDDDIVLCTQHDLGNL